MLTLFGFEQLLTNENNLYKLLDGVSGWKIIAFGVALGGCNEILVNPMCIVGILCKKRKSNFGFYILSSFPWCFDFVPLKGEVIGNKTTALREISNFIKESSPFYKGQQKGYFVIESKKDSS